ncbi:MAG TPA: 2-C-methyl-D-erythritol 4-phosphate cytidylyltransferase [Chitinophagaceae bacterium]|jgi:2-C-methyl-D-erythritol 4-phosphate cytidylyltransferase|nr:2-C-methyl-D-erythritol 4-phosphate cytidylyltransferase [Chitinophagaceae bacterium]
MKKYAVIVAGGSGLRMGSVLPKQFLLIHNKPVLWYTLHVFLKSYKDIHIILVLPESYYDTGRAICDEMDSFHPIQTITGGNTRFHSVQRGLSLVRDESVVFIHDAVRCLLTPSLIHLCFEETIRFGSAIPCVDSKDSVRILTEKGPQSVKRTDIKLVQTPQTFLSNILLPAYQTVYRDVFTDDASVVEASDHPVHLVEGEVNNIKITTPLDLAIAEELLDPPQTPV